MPCFICANCGRVFTPKWWAVGARCPHCGHMRKHGLVRERATFGAAIGLLLLVGAFVYAVLTHNW